MGRWVNFSLKAPKQNTRLAVVGDGSECQGLIFCDFRKTTKEFTLLKTEIQITNHYITQAIFIKTNLGTLWYA